MRVNEIYSHLNGLEFMKIQKPKLLDEILDIVDRVGIVAEDSTKSQKWSLSGIQADAAGIMRQFEEGFRKKKWRGPIALGRTGVSLLTNKVTLKSTASSDDTELDDGRVVLENIQTDFVKDRVAVQVQFGKHANVAHNLFVTHLACYVRDQIDVGIDILPMQKLQTMMGSTVPYFERERHSVTKQGRGVPAVPLIVVGIEPESRLSLALSVVKQCGAPDELTGDS